VADAEVRQTGLARMARSNHLAFKSTIAETAWDQDAVDASQDRGTLAFDLAGFQPLQRDPGPLAQATVLERLGQRLVRVLVVDVLPHDADGDRIHRVFGRVNDGFPLRQ